MIIEEKTVILQQITRNKHIQRYETTDLHIPSLIYLRDYGGEGMFRISVWKKTNANELTTLIRIGQNKQKAHIHTEN